MSIYYYEKNGSPIVDGKFNWEQLDVVNWKKHWFNGAFSRDFAPCIEFKGYDDGLFVAYGRTSRSGRGDWAFYAGKYALKAQNVGGGQWGIGSEFFESLHIRPDPFVCGMVHGGLFGSSPFDCIKEYGDRVIPHLLKMVKGLKTTDRYGMLELTHISTRSTLANKDTIKVYSQALLDVLAANFETTYDTYKNPNSANVIVSQQVIL